MRDTMTVYTSLDMDVDENRAVWRALVEISDEGVVVAEDQCYFDITQKDQASDWMLDTERKLIEDYEQSIGDDEYAEDTDS